MFENISEIILKVTRDCNLRCEYCYVKNKDNYKNERMSFEIFQTIIERIVSDKEKNIRALKNTNVQIIFHGGEPTLMPIETLEQFIDYAQKRLPGVSFGMQTNMTNLNEPWLAFFKKHNLRPGVSIDGWSAADNTLRSKDAELITKLDLLNAAGIGYGPLMVLTKNNIKKFYPNACTIIKHAQVNRIKANYAENTQNPKRDKTEVSAHDLFKYVFSPVMQHFFKTQHCIEENVLHFIRSYIETLVFIPISHKKSCHSNCLAKFCGGGNNVIEIDADGFACFCGRWADVQPINTLGTITDPDLFGLSSYLQGLKIHILKAKEIRHKKCDTCFAQHLCTYSCAAFAYDKYGKIHIREDLVCTYVKQIMKFFNKHHYELLIHYVKSNPWEIREDKQAYYLNLPLENTDQEINKNITDRFISWGLLQDKLYLRIDKKALRGKKIKL